jgi:hypothetical protein
MKTQPEPEVILMTHASCCTDSREALPALQLYEVDNTVADKRHDHILRAALLASSHGLSRHYRQ